ARAVLLHDGAQPAVARSDVVGEEPEEQVAVHLVEVAAERGGGEEGVVALVERVELRDAEPSADLAHRLRGRRRDLEEPAPAARAVARVEGGLGRAHAHQHLGVHAEGGGRLEHGRLVDACALGHGRERGQVGAARGGVDLVCERQALGLGAPADQHAEARQASVNGGTRGEPKGGARRRRARAQDAPAPPSAARARPAAASPTPRPSSRQPSASSTALTLVARRRYTGRRMRYVARFFFMHLGSFVPVFTYFYLCGTAST